MGEQELIHKIWSEAVREKLWTPADTIVVAVSGGPDSTALLDMLYRIAPDEGLKLVAAHVDHGFRGEESAQEAEAVRIWANALGIACETIYIDMPAYIEETGMNAQAAARQRRYEFLHQVAAQYGASRIALAHHADDQAETVLMRILRGTSTSGLAGIPMARSEKNVQLIRPLLRINKTDILNYCTMRGLSFSEDSSNNKRDYSRNRIRLDVLPALTAFNPQLSESLVRLSVIAAAEDDWMEEEARKAYSRHVQSDPDGCRIDRKALLGLQVALQRRLIKLILSHMGLEKETTITFDLIETSRRAAEDGAASTWRMDAGGGLRIAREYDSMRFNRISASDGSVHGTGTYLYELEEGTRRMELSEAGACLTFTWEEGCNYVKPAGRNEAAFDADQLTYPLVIRSRIPGDRMQVLGLNGTKKVQDMFVDERVPPSRREVMPLLVDATGTILWIPGIRRGAAAQVTDMTRRVLRIRADFAGKAE
ncbi:tRNA(Ile)-lysidine synthase [Paenibacillus phyllosphaerae]|uniref:tRNA(Ile)-lysidine synthase n=1 Tax=Paenibacillus phyllosphaerae TaxID=274593 RepID=A0A7W5B4Q2_9BACL|nr:tRNA lysidine(34) synthetase TilS [Paenibacillus phyllosphaerae]MBB3114129.1 tRNA(Ile)-lysidine synthase [Paenibacillus phyllosphaerae]